ncbi:winged helix-turn-helix domain-containing protein [Rheinheimera sp. F8]|uniref:winged helix-turn-helix domain-containing protein n=1 Tax=Rheinheimera sp. F8 TaxID=1763998 RepID=UPI000AE33CF8|nr:winged helix-turn-helix domain-containing protein [Rheinheimera sp. F8]
MLADPATAPCTAPAAPDGLTIWQFGDYEFQPAQDLLRHLPSGTESKLEPKVAELLRLFLLQPGVVLTQEFLQQSLWPHLVVEQNSLYQLLTKLRKLLNDASRQPLYIKTVPKKGYCLIAAVVSAELTAEAAVQHRTAAPGNNLFAPAAGRSVLLPRWQIYAAVALVLAGIAGFRAVASFGDDKPAAPPVYEVSDVSYALGAEFDVDAHPIDDLLAYIKDVYSLEITDKHGVVSYQQRFAERIVKPAWHDTQKLLAFWHFREDSCELQILSATGAVSHIATPIACQQVQKPVWQSAEELVLVVRQQHKQRRQWRPYLYRTANREWVPIPLSLQPGQQLVTAVKGWQGEVFYLLKDDQHQSLLIDISGQVKLRWPYPVWLIAFDPSQGVMVTNDNAKHTSLQALAPDGRRYPVFTTAQGLFTSLGIDRSGVVYTGLEAWQVDIRDQDNLPIFSTSSIDYLPVSNRLGETAFMSRRSGVCEVYLHSQGRITQLSQYQGYDFVNFLEWRPDLSMLASNRDQDIVLYDRKNTLLQFPSLAQTALLNLGWVDNERLFSFDGTTLRLYNLQGRVLQQQALHAQNVYFDVQQHRWLVHQKQGWYQLAASDLTAATRLQLLQQLQPQQSHQMQNIRIRNNRLYWQSDWSKHDYIWSMALDGQHQAAQSPVQLLKSGNLIWHFDVTPYGELTIAQMDAVEGDIKQLKPVAALTE